MDASIKSKIVAERMAFIDSLFVKRGAHGKFEYGCCVMEAVAYVAGEEHGDTPQCACPVLSNFMRSWNDAMNDTDRQLLKPYIPKLVGTRSTSAVEKRRSYLAIDWYLREFTPTWLELANLGEYAAKLRAFGQVQTETDVAVMQEALSAADSAAWSAAESAAWSAADSAAWSAARSAAWSAAWSAARSAAWSAAESAAWSAAESAAWSAARSAADSAARSAAESAAESAAWSAALSAAEQALEGTVKRLQKSAFGLLDRMLAVTSEA